MEYLNLFNDLDVVQSVEKKDWTLFRYEKGKNLMIYDRKTDFVYINYDQIWSVLRNDFGLNYDETQQVTEEWVEMTYNLRGVTTGEDLPTSIPLVGVVYNLRGVTTWSHYLQNQNYGGSSL
jgi:hypothetical protein